MKPALLLLALASVTAGQVALADDKSECLDAASNGQTLRDAHKLIEARDQFRVCARAQCPSVVQMSCVEWLESAEKSLPTVVLGAKNGAGADLVDVEVTVDGAVLATKLEGRSIPMNPGPHAFHFALADGTTVDEQVVVKEGEKIQPIGAVLGRAPETPPTPATTSAHEQMRPRAVAGLAIAGVGVVLVGIGLAFGASAISQNNSSAAYCDVGGVKDDCYGQGVTLRNDAVNNARVSTLLLGVGAVAVAGGVVLWLTSPSSTLTATVGFDARGLHVGGTF